MVKNKILKDKVKPSYKTFCYISLIVAFNTITGCSTFGPLSLEQTRLQYNETVKATTEQQLLLNIVRLRYTDTPSSLAVSAIAAQFERSQSFALIPFFVAGSDNNARLTNLLPQAQVSGADRPTFSLTPLDDQEFTRKLFTPIPLDGIIYLTKTTWPISTVFRLYLENLNWVSNAQSASGPTPTEAPIYEDFLTGIKALQTLQDRGDIVFSIEDKEEIIGSELALNQVKATDLLDAAKNGYEYKLNKVGTKWSLLKKTAQPVLLVNPQSLTSAEMLSAQKLFHLQQGLTKYIITQEALNPFASTYPADGVANIDLETRSLLQAMYFVSQGIDIPAIHESQGLVTITHDNAGAKFNWQQVTSGLFHVKSSTATVKPVNAHVAVQYKGCWFYIDDTDQATKSTFSLLMELSRLELISKSDSGPILTLPVGSH
ncbi:MAG: hypothetical protein H7Z70_01425 [Bacteroidia bacterium]|nr:hypothetical protein [Methylotenera sp.]